MSSDLYRLTRAHPLARTCRRLALGIGILCGLCWQTVLQATETDVPIQCSIHTIENQKVPTEAIEDCIEFGAAVGELGLEWRQKLPPKVRWITRKDAKTICSQKTSEWGQRVGSPMDQGCVFLTPQDCTILTSSYISHATLGNAVRACSP